jgi:hypothetical protein
VRMRRVLLLLLLLAASPGCLVLSLQPAYDDDWLAWDPNLIGAWHADDNASLKIDGGDWRSYRVHYEHPIEKADLTGFLTIVGDAHYLDLMPPKGEDHGTFLMPVHAVLRVELSSDTLTLTPLSYDWFANVMKHGQSPGDLQAVFDQRQNALIVSPTSALRAWLRKRPADNAAWGAPATFTRVKP